MTVERRAGFFRGLFSNDDRTADSIIFCGVLSLLAFIALAAYDVVWEGHGFNELSFGSGVAAILAGIGGGKTLRDRMGTPDVSVRTEVTTRGGDDAPVERLR